MYQVGLKKQSVTTYKPGFYSTLAEAKKIGEKECESGGSIVIKEFTKSNTIKRINIGSQKFVWVSI